ncbi:MAG: hypothetical protein V1860_03805, partial [bacterium]
MIDKKEIKKYFTRFSVFIKPASNRVKNILKYKYFPIIAASLSLVFLFLLSYSYGSRPPRKRNLTTTPLLWAKLDGTLTDENSSGSTFAYSPGKPATETGV